LPFINLDDDDDDFPGDPDDPGHSDDPYQGDLLQQSRDLALRNPRLSSAMLERRFKIRKSVADEIIDELRGEGLVIGG
jgi:DNA segregation ATPase FtsK/SpoIIIE-like protein